MKPEHGWQEYRALMKIAESWEQYNSKRFNRFMCSMKHINCSRKRFSVLRMFEMNTPFSQSKAWLIFHAFADTFKLSSSILVTACMMLDFTSGFVLVGSWYTISSRYPHKSSHRASSPVIEEAMKWGRLLRPVVENLWCKYWRKELRSVAELQPGEIGFF